MSAKKFWYISYRCECFSKCEQGKVVHTMIEQHPVDAVAEMTEEFPDNGPWVLVFAIEVTEEQYTDYKDILG